MKGALWALYSLKEETQNNGYVWVIGISEQTKIKESLLDQHNALCSYKYFKHTFSLFCFIMKLMPQSSV